MEDLQQAGRLVEVHHDGVGELLRQAPVLLLQGPLPRQDHLDLLGVAGLGAGVDQLVLPLLPGVAAHHQHIEKALHPRLLGELAVGVLRADAVGDHVEPSGIAMLAQLLRDHAAGAVDVGESVEEGVPEAVIHKVVDPLAVAQVQGEGDVLRLAVEGRRVGDAQLLHMPQAHDPQGGGHHEVDHVRPGRRLLEHVPVGDGQPHPLAGEQVLHHREKAHLPHRVLVVRRLAGGDDPHLVAVVLERPGEPPGADGGAVVGVVKLVDDQNDLHKRLNRLSLVWRQLSPAAGDLLVYHVFSGLSRDFLSPCRRRTRS